VAALIKVWPVLGVFLTVVGGIYGGVFTPTEGAAVGGFGTGLIAWLAGGLTRATLADSFFVTAKSTAMIFFIVLGAAFYNGFLALTQVPQEIAAWVVEQGFSPWAVLILVFYLLLGCLMDSLSMILLTIPIFWPVVQGLDFGMVSMAEMHAVRTMEALAKGVALAPDMLASVQATLAAGVELTREQISALGLRGATQAHWHGLIPNKPRFGLAFWCSS